MSQLVMINQLSAEIRTPTIPLSDDEPKDEIKSVMNYFKNEYKNSTEGDPTGLMILCSFLLDMGKLDTIEKLLRRILKELSSDDILNKARCYYQLGNIALDRNQYDIALDSLNLSNEIIQYSVDICEEATKEDQLVIATCYANIGSLYRVKQDFEKGFEYYQKALIIRERYIPIPHSTIGNLHIKLTQIYLDRGQAELAFPHYRKALEICSKCIPRDHPLLSKAYYIAAMTHQNFDTGAKAIEFSDGACVARYRDSSLTYTWNPLDKKLCKCPRCQK